MQVAGKLGDKAVAIGMETLDLARIHEEALATLITPSCGAMEGAEMTRRAAMFFSEAVAPVEKTHRIAREASDDLNRVNATLLRRTLQLADSHRQLQQGIARRKVAVESLKISEDQSARILQESRHLQKRLRDMARRTLSAQEYERMRLSLKLQDEIAQTLLGIHVRMLALDREILLSTLDFKKKIATTERLVKKSAKIITRFAREFGIPHED